MSGNMNDPFANNRGVVKSWKGLVLAIAGVSLFTGYVIAMVILSMVPPLKWLMIALTGLVFFVVGVVFLVMSKNSYNLPLFAMMIGTLLLYMSITEEFFPAIREGLGDKATGGIMLAFGIIMVIFPFAAVKYYRSKYRISVDAVVVEVERHVSRSRKGHHALTYRPVYEFTYQGRTYEVTDKVYASGSHPSTGEERELLIDERKPERFIDIERVKTKRFSSFIGPIIVIALGIYLITAG